MNRGRLNTAALWLALIAVAFLNWGPGYASRNGSGTFVIPNVFAPNTTISSAAFNANFSDIAQEITNSLALDGQSSMTGPIKAASGTEGVPSITFSADLDTGFYRIGSNNVGFSAGGSKVVDISTSGLDATTIMQGGSTLVPAGITVAYAGSTAPGGYLLSYGQAISRTTYANLFTAIGTAYGSGDGSTTFNTPDCRGRVIAGLDNMGGSAAGRLDSATTVGATQGAKSQTLIAGNLPSHTHNYSGATDSQGAHSHTVTVPNSTGAVSATANQAQPYVSAGSVSTSTDGAHTHNFAGTTDGGNGLSATAFAIVQPTIIMNCIIKY